MVTNKNCVEVLFIVNLLNTDLHIIGRQGELLLSIYKQLTIEVKEFLFGQYSDLILPFARICYPARIPNSMVCVPQTIVI